MYKKRIVTFILTFVLCMVMGVSVFAGEKNNVLSSNPPSELTVINNIKKGKNPPAKKADTHDLSVSNYNYQVSDMGYRVYTSKWLKGASSIKISVSNWKLIDSYKGATNNKLTVRVYNSKKKEVKSKQITISSKCGSGTISGLNSSKKYYICFEVPTNGNRYSFDGTISKK